MMHADGIISGARAEIKGHWTPALPLNETKPYKSLVSRFRDALLVFRCRAVAVVFAEHEKR